MVEMKVRMRDSSLIGVVAKQADTPPPASISLQHCEQRPSSKAHIFNINNSSSNNVQQHCAKTHTCFQDNQGRPHRQPVGEKPEEVRGHVRAHASQDKAEHLSPERFLEVGVSVVSQSSQMWTL
ncbi:hypothetical protein GN956_G11509 [Arapaima gigas]